MSSGTWNEAGTVDRYGYGSLLVASCSGTLPLTVEQLVNGEWSVLIGDNPMEGFVGYGPTLGKALAAAATRVLHAERSNVQNTTAVTR